MVSMVSAITMVFDQRRNGGSTARHHGTVPKIRKLRTFRILS